jgi:5-oxoprolinase (ATP-hydrolysing)
VVEIDARVVLDKAGLVVGSTGERLSERQPLDEAAVRVQLQAVYETGIKSLAVVMMHSYLYQEHEAIVGRIAQEIGFTHVSRSSDVMQMARIVPRGYTACADAYLTPCIKQYLDGFASGFESRYSS